MTRPFEIINKSFHDSFVARLGVTEWILIAISLYIAKSFIYAFLISPVRHVPGPWYCRVSRLPLLYATYKFRRTAWVVDIMSQYPSATAVIIAPDQIHTTDEDAMKIIYDRSSIKTTFYSGMGSWKGVTSILGFRDYASSAATRNMLIKCFQNKNLATLVENVQSHVLELVDILKAKSRANEPVDGVVIFRLLALDVVTDVLWGEEKTLLSQMDDSTPDFLRRFFAFSQWNAFKSFVPGADTYVRYFGTEKWRGLRSDCMDLDITAKEALQRWDEKGASRHDRDVLSMLQSMSDLEDPAKRIPEHHMPAFMVEFLAAGSSTTSHTVAFTCHLLARNKAAQDRLREELLETFPDVNAIDPRKTMDLPYLDAVLKETMRLYPMIPGPEERHLGKDIEVDGIRVPPGIVASTAPYTQGRLEEVFPQSATWIPERWLDRNERMELNWIPFGTGCRACPGANLATTELKYMIGTIFRHFRSVVPVGHENDALELADVFAAGCKSGHCWLKFELAEEKI